MSFTLEIPEISQYSEDTAIIKLLFLPTTIRVPRNHISPLCFYISYSILRLRLTTRFTLQNVRLFEYASRVGMEFYDHEFPYDGLCVKGSGIGIIMTWQ